jgi:hypothetical protein
MTSAGVLQGTTRAGRAADAGATASKAATANSGNATAKPAILNRDETIVIRHLHELQVYAARRKTIRK